jgi:hypothetical protein
VDEEAAKNEINTMVRPEFARRTSQPITTSGTNDEIVGSSKSTLKRSRNNRTRIRSNFGTLILAAIFVSLSQWRLFLSPATDSDRGLMIRSHPEYPILDSVAQVIRPRFDIHQTIAIASNTSHEESAPPPILVQPANTNLWQDSMLLPDWMKNYLDWHNEQRNHLTESNFESHRFIIMIAKKGQVTGGVTDRLRPLPAFLRIANATNRIFMIHWDRPAHLEEFLLPPQGGLDWRVPAWMEPHLHNVSIYGNQGKILQVAKGRLKIQACVYQSWNYGELYYDEHLESGDADAKTVF